MIGLQSVQRALLHVSCSLHVLKAYGEGEYYKGQNYLNIVCWKVSLAAITEAFIPILIHLL